MLPEKSIGHGLRPRPGSTEQVEYRRNTAWFHHLRGVFREMRLCFDEKLRWMSDSAQSPSESLDYVAECRCRARPRLPKHEFSQNDFFLSGKVWPRGVSHDRLNSVVTLSCRRFMAATFILCSLPLDRKRLLCGAKGQQCAWSWLPGRSADIEHQFASLRAEHMRD